MELLKSKIKRKKYLRPAWTLFLVLVIILPLIGVSLFYILPKDMYYGNFLGFILGSFVFVSVPNLCIFGGYLLHCFGRSGTQTLNLFEDVLVYSYYNGSFDNRTTYTFYIKNITAYSLTKRLLLIDGDIKRKSEGRHKGDTVVYKMRIPRTFNDEDKILAFLDNNVK